MTLMPVIMSDDSKSWGYSGTRSVSCVHSDESKAKHLQSISKASAKHSGTVASHGASEPHASEPRSGSALLTGRLSLLPVAHQYACSFVAVTTRKPASVRRIKYESSMEGVTG